MKESYKSINFTELRQIVQCPRNVFSFAEAIDCYDTKGVEDFDFFPESYLTFRMGKNI